MVVMFDAPCMKAHRMASNLGAKKGAAISMGVWSGAGQAG
jgi:hypothetical protein